MSKSVPKSPKIDANGSKGEQRIRKLLSDLKVIFYEQFTFSGCKDKRSLPFDFFGLHHSIPFTIEYDGRQHFEHCAYYHGSNPKHLETQQQHDIIKNQFTKDNGISLLRISYKEDNHIEKEVTTFLSQLEKKKIQRVEKFTNSKLYSSPYGKSSWSCIIV